VALVERGDAHGAEPRCERDERRVGKSSPIST
jgi:hypothetical protein